MMSMPSFSYAVPNARRTDRLSDAFANRFPTSIINRLLLLPGVPGHPEFLPPVACRYQCRPPALRC